MTSLRTIVRILIAISASCATTTVAFVPSNNNNNNNAVPSTITKSTTTTNLNLRKIQAPSNRLPSFHHHSSWTSASTSRLYASNIADASSSSSSSSESTSTSTLEPLQQTQEELQLTATSIEEEFTPQQQLINALFLAASFGYVFYTILNIDQGMTRGWTGSEIAMRIPLDNWGAYESYLANKPIMTKTLINVIIYLLGDWLSQTAFAGKNVLHFDIKRTLRNGFIGLCFGPLVHQYYQFSDTILPPEDGLVTRLQKILMDQTIYLTVKCSVYISAVGLLNGDDWESVQETVKEKIGGVVITAWKFWPLVHCITYGLIPARHRILWVNSVDLVWNAILATMSQKDEEVAVVVDAEAVAVEGEEAVAVLSSASGVDKTEEEEEKDAGQDTQTPLLVLDNQLMESKKEEVVEMFTNNHSTNTTSCANAALGTA